MHIGGQVEDLEARWEELDPMLLALTEKCKTQNLRINSMLDQMDDLENRSCRINIRIRGVPEATVPQDIVPTLQGVFKQILGLEVPTYIEIDRAHRALCLPSEDPDKSQDIISKLHKYSLKQCIMFHVRGTCFVDIDGAKLSIFPDLSCRTLLQRRAMKPLLEVL